MTGYWLLRSLLAALIFLCVAQSIARGHDIYTDWKQPDYRDGDKRKLSCCNNVDCAPRRARFMGDHWQVEFQGRWLRVPDQKVETNYGDSWDTPDGQSHACINPNGVVYCFTPGTMI